ncbi:MAG: hypothetical protein NC412_08680 [Roseburia sp.]|nr:hypothetical protein [Roseburia sp.]MCM1279001.1 hypothetical protein [Robinsoniella sp.]
MRVVFLDKSWYIGERGAGYIDTEEEESPFNRQSVRSRISDFLNGYWNKAYTAVFE